MANPYALGRTSQSQIGPPSSEADMLAGQSRFAVASNHWDEEGKAPYSSVGWSPTLKSSPISTPDSARLQQEPLYEFQAEPNKPPTKGFYPSRDADKKARHSVEQVIPNGLIPETKSGFNYPNPAAGANRFGRNPRETPPAEPRMTSRLAPISYSFIRPFMHGLPKNIRPHLNGMHFSMADHKRGKEYNSTGMAPNRKPGAGTRNTYRLSPTPWDSQITDMPPVNQNPRRVEAPPAVSVMNTSRSWRL